MAERLTVYYTYDDSGNVLTEETDLDGDGTADFRLIRTYDGNRDTVIRELDIDGDGIIDPLGHTIYTYDADGNLIRQEPDIDDPETLEMYWNFMTEKCTQIYHEHDFIPFGECDHFVDNYFERTPELLRFRYANLIFPYGTVFLKETFVFGTCNQTYDENGNMLTRECDYDNDGTAEELYTNTYDENGRVFRAALHYPGDETTITVVNLRTYDANGNIQTQEWDANGDGTMDVRSTYAYDCWE